MRLILTTAFVIATATAAFAQGAGTGGSGSGTGTEPPRLGDANPPRGALRNGGIPPAAAMRRGDEMAPLAQRNVSARFGGPQEFGNNPTPTRNDPRGTRKNCRGGCAGGQ